MLANVISSLQRAAGGGRGDGWGDWARGGGLRGGRGYVPLALGSVPEIMRIEGGA